MLQCWEYKHIAVVQLRELHVHNIPHEHHMWYKWAWIGKITWVHKTMEVYHKVMDGLMDDK